jgi:hypothetical protein
MVSEELRKAIGKVRVYVQTQMDFFRCLGYGGTLPPTCSHERYSMEDLHRPEIRAFVLASETLLSTIPLDAPWTQDEKKLVWFYVTSLAAQCHEE